MAEFSGIYYDAGASGTGGDTDFMVWIVVAALLIIIMFCVVEAIAYSIRLHRAAEFKEKDS